MIQFKKLFSLLKGGVTKKANSFGNYRSAHKITTVVFFGFLLIAVLMIAMFFVGINNSAELEKQMAHIVKFNGIKIKLTNEMLTAVNGRALSMYKYVVLEDAFLRDDEFMHFTALGTHYYKARTKVEALVSTAQEFAVINESNKIAKKTQTIVENIIKASVDNVDKNIIFKKIRQEAVPNQQRIILQLNKLVSLQTTQANLALTQAKVDYLKTRNIMLLLGFLVVSLSAIIAYFVISRVKNQAGMLEYQALHDELTGLANRALFQDRLESLLISSKRQENATFYLVLLDLDRFKNVNDTLGHYAGDLLLQEVAIRLKDNIRESDTIARLGGDEFAIILEDLPYHTMFELLEKLTRMISQLFYIAEQEIDVGVSMGIVSYPVDGKDSMTLLNRADSAMYEAKRKGMSFVCYSDNLESV